MSTKCPQDVIKIIIERIWWYIYWIFLDMLGWRIYLQGQGDDDADGEEDDDDGDKDGVEDF